MSKAHPPKHKIRIVAILVMCLSFIVTAISFRDEVSLLLLKSLLIIGPEDSRLWATDKLSERKDGLSGLVIALEDPNPKVRISASNDISSLGEKTKEATPSLILALNDTRESIRINAVHSLGKLSVSINSPQRAMMIKALANTAIHDSSPLVCGEAAIVLDEISKTATLSEIEHARKIFIFAATSSKRSVRESAYISLSLTNPKFFPNTKILVNGLKDSSDIVRTYAGESLGRQKLLPKLVVPALTKALFDQDRNVRMYVAIALGDFGREARHSVPTLLKVFLKECYGRRFLTSTLNKIGLEFVLPHLKKAEKSNDVAESNAAKSLLKAMANSK